MRIDKTEIEDRALKIRQEHNIQTYGIKDIFSLILQSGIHLIRYPFGINTVLGFSTFFEGKKVIVSNTSEILAREIFTIAHELGHIVYDFENKYSDVKIDIEISENSNSISEDRAFHFANCFLMPEEELIKYIKYELKKKHQEINALDIVRMQLEFQVSYSAMVVRLYDLDIIKINHKAKLFDNRNTLTSKALFKMLNEDEKLIKQSNVIELPPMYLEYVINNYEKDYIPYESLKKALNLIYIDSEVLKKEKAVIDTEKLDIDDIFEEFG